MTTYCQEIQHTLLPTKASIWLFFLFIRPGTFLKQSLASSTFPRDPAQTETNKNMLQLHYIHWSCNVKNVCREWSGLCTAWDVSDNTTAAHQYFIYDTKSATEVQHRFRYYLTLISMVRGSVLEFDTGWADLRKQWSASDAIHGTPQTVRTHENLTESKKTFFNTVHDVWLYRAEDELTPKAFIFNSTAKKKNQKNNTALFGRSVQMCHLSVWWLSCFPDLSVFYSFLWGFFKDHVYRRYRSRTQTGALTDENLQKHLWASF